MSNQIFVMFASYMIPCRFTTGQSKSHSNHLIHHVCWSWSLTSVLVLVRNRYWLSSDLWCSDFLIELRKNVDDIPRSSLVEGSINSTQYIWFYFKQSHYFPTWRESPSVISLWSPFDWLPFPDLRIFDSRNPNGLFQWVKSASLWLVVFANW